MRHKDTVHITSKIIWFLSSAHSLAFQQQNSVSEIGSAFNLKLNSGKARIQSHVLCPSCIPEKKWDVNQNGVKKEKNETGRGLCNRVQPAKRCQNQNERAKN